MKNQNDCGAIIKQIHDELEKSVNNQLRPHDLTMAQMKILLILNDTENKQLSLKDLEQIFHVAQSTTAGIVSRLEQKKLLESIGDPNDKRIKKVRITPEGILRCKEAKEHIEKTETRLTSNLTEAERTTLLTLLKKIRDSIC